MLIPKDAYIFFNWMLQKFMAVTRYMYLLDIVCSTLAPRGGEIRAYLQKRTFVSTMCLSDLWCIQLGVVLIPSNSLLYIIPISESCPTRRIMDSLTWGSWIRIRWIVGTCTRCSYGLIQPTELKYSSDKLWDNHHSTFFPSNTWVFSKVAHSHLGVARQDAKTLNGIMRD